MLLSSWLKPLNFSSSLNRTRRTRKNKRQFTPLSAVELLEDRTLLSVTFGGDDDGLLVNQQTTFGSSSSDGGAAAFVSDEILVGFNAEIANLFRGKSVQPKLYHMGFRGRIARSTMADANRNRDWRIYADFAQTLIQRARKLSRNESFGLDLDGTLYALDSTTIDLCLSLFPWATFRRRQGAAFFLAYAKKNLDAKRRQSRLIDKATGLRSDQTIVLSGVKSSQSYPEALRRIHDYDIETGKRLVFLTNNFVLPALTIAQLDKCRWQIELFFKWIKQHLRIKACYGTSPDAVRTQIWIAISVYVLIAIVKKKRKIERSLSEILQILSVNPFEKTPILQLLTSPMNSFSDTPHPKQLLLFDF